MNIDDTGVDTEGVLTGRKAGPKASSVPALDLAWLKHVDPDQRVASFVERYCRLTLGGKARSNVKLFEYQRELLSGLTAPGHARRAYVQMPKKNAKSFLGSAIGLARLVSEEGAEVYSLAHTFDQAKIIWNTSRRMVELDPELSESVIVYKDYLWYPPTNGVFRPLPGNWRAQHGLNPSTVLFDEIHTQRDDEAWEAMSLAMGTREEPLMCGFTTPGVDQVSLAKTLYDYGKSAQDSDFFFRVFEPYEAECDYKDEQTWFEANPALGKFLSLSDMRAAIKVTPEATFRRFRLGQWWASGDEALVNSNIWDALQQAPESSIGGTKESVVLALNVNFRGNSAALMAVSVSDTTPVLRTLAIWTPSKQAGSLWKVSKYDVMDVVEQAFSNYRVRRFYVNPPYWEAELLLWQARYGVRRVQKFPMYSRSRMVSPTTSFQAAVSGAGLMHDHDERVRQQVTSVGVSTSEAGDSMLPSEISGVYVEAAFAAAVAYWGSLMYKRTMPRFLGGADEIVA